MKKQSKLFFKKGKSRRGLNSTLIQLLVLSLWLQMTIQFLTLQNSPRDKYFKYIGYSTAFPVNFYREVYMNFTGTWTPVYHGDC